MQITPISNSSYSQACSFNGKNLDALSKVIPDTKAYKGLTGWQKNFFKQYLIALSTAVVFSKAELDELDKCKYKEYPEKYIKMFCDKKNIPEELRPGSMFLKLEDCSGGFYEAFNNNLILNSGIYLTKQELFSLLRHEMRHYEQSLEVLRHETYGPQDVDFMAEKACEMSLPEFIHNIMEVPEEEWNTDNEEELELVRGFKQALEIDYEKGKKDLANYVKGLCASSLNERRNLIISHFGEIKTGSKKSDEIKNFYKGLLNGNNQIVDGVVNWKLYFSSPTEYDAHCAEDMAIAQQEGKCFMRVLREKQEFLMNSDSPNTKKALEEILEENPNADFFI